MTDFYAVMSLPRDCTRVQVKERFRQLVRERHPDLFRGDEKAEAEVAFQAVTEAFNNLIDPLRRRQHDIALDQALRKQQKQDPDYLVKTYLNRGIRAYKQQNYLEAANNFVLATESAPQNAQAWHHLAMASMQKEHWLPKAQEAIERACELKPQDVSYLKLAGKIFSQSGMADRARQYYNRALEAGGDNDPAIRKALQSLGQPPQRQAETGRKKSGFFGKSW